MKKILSIVDKTGSAIHRLEEMNRVRLPHLEYHVCTLHPKRPSQEEVQAIKSILDSGVDVIHAAYWKSAMKFIELFGEQKVPVVLTHQNEHNINDTEKNHWEWKDQEWSAQVSKNLWQKEQLAKQGIETTYIRHGYESQDLKYAVDLTKEKTVLYVGQIKKVKGVRELADACKRLGYALKIIGHVSESEYYYDLIEKYGDIITHVKDVPNEQMASYYHTARVYVCNSDDGTESGTMPITEAMACGIPVVTRRIGHVRDMGEHKKNMWVRSGSYTDIEDLMEGLKMVVENDDIANDLRENAWKTVRPYNADLQAIEYEKLFKRVVHKEPSVSLIIPTCDRHEVLQENLSSLNEQSYDNFEVVIANDGLGDLSKIIDTSLYRYPVKFVKTKDHEGYNLAEARNRGVIAASGKILVFCDDRLKMDQNAIHAFVTFLTSLPEKNKTWIWGSKGAFKSFVENFSCAYRQQIINAGMFCERIEEYGGMTQEVSSRYSAQGFDFQWCPEATAEPIIGTHSKSRNREAIVRSKMQLCKMGFN